MYELISLIKISFFSLNNQCMLLLEQIKKYMFEYINQTDDLLYLSELLHEKDFFRRDSLEFISKLELLDILQLPKVEAVVNRIYRSDYDCGGAYWEQSSMYSILKSDAKRQIDVELESRFYKKRNMNEMPQNNLQYQIYKYSLLSRLRYSSLIFALYVIGSMVYYSKLIVLQRTLTSVFQEGDSDQMTDGDLLVYISSLMSN